MKHINTDNAKTYKGRVPVIVIGMPAAWLVTRYKTSDNNHAGTNASTANETAWTKTTPDRNHCV